MMNLEYFLFPPERGPQQSVTHEYPHGGQLKVHVGYPAAWSFVSTFW